MADNFFYDAADEPAQSPEFGETQNNNKLNEPSQHFSQLKTWKFCDSSDDEEEFVPEHAELEGIRKKIILNVHMNL